MPVAFAKRFRPPPRRCRLYRTPPTRCGLLKPFAALTSAETQILADLTRTHPVFNVYLSDARAATRGGATNRTALVGRDGIGAALGIAFDRIEVRTIVGRLSPDEERAIADLPDAGEIHVDRDAASRIRDSLGRRVTRIHQLLYYAIGQRPARSADPRCTRLTRDHLELVRHFFAAHYPETIFSPWMLDRLFLGIIENGELVACGGVVAAAEGISNIGNFLTAPDYRGRGLGRGIATTLVHRLFDQGMLQVTLGTTQDNPAACRAYEASGFVCFDRRLQLDIS
ncbi:MAG: GNAT family N-acetyltransferase [Rhodopseudomonas sp.]|uniref:GNAT family N-acetyltransferase n=1 Tax=Rhodopseudomonas sp. TaxID=1078 RepID=UPI0039E5EF8F